jgi:anaerobic magnesium-protoporphyrin IX monomethyl ester cyclase
MEKVCLIVPPSLILSKERTLPHLGISSVAAVLKEKKIPVDHIDLSGVPKYLEAVSTYVQNSDVKTFGLTATSPQLPASVKIREVIKKHRPDAKVILGGPHPTLVSAARFREKKLARAGRHFKELTQLFDTIVAGDGELAILEALQNPQTRFINADDPHSPYWLKPEDLNIKVFPARDLLDLESYEYYIDGVRATTMIAQLGCPYPCGFCGGRYTSFLRKVRLRDTASVIAELRHIYQTYGIRGIMFYDDELNVNPKIIELMYAIARLGGELKIEWRLRGFIKSNLFTAEQARAMFEAGFREILIGFESASPRILKNINKKATLEQNSKCMEIAKNAGLRVKALMSIGHPGESEESIRETEEWVLANQPESLDVTRITVYPGTPYFDDAEPHPTIPKIWTYTINGDSLHAAEVDYLVDFMGYKGDRGVREGLLKFSTFTNFLSSEELEKLIKGTEDRLREKLGQPYQVDVPGIEFEHSMGMGLPDNILRSSH